MLTSRRPLYPAVCRNPAATADTVSFRHLLIEPPLRSEPIWLSPADMSNASMLKTNLSNADLTGADLSGVIFQEVDLSGTSLPDANLSGTCFSLGKYRGGLFFRFSGRG